MHRFLSLSLLLTFLWGLTPGVEAQPASDEALPVVSLSLGDAIAIALENNYALQGSALDLETADAQIREAYGSVYPNVDLNSSYTRNLKSPNPFAGSSAGGLFGALGQIDWLAYNEEARTDGDDLTLPLDLGEFRRRQGEGLDAAGIVIDGSDNPFAVENQFTNSVQVSQTLYDGSLFSAIKAARSVREFNQLAFDRQTQQVINNTRQAFYTALLAHEQADVVAKSMARTARTVEETRKRVTQGVASKYQRLSAEVELANLQTSYIQTENMAASALDNLKMAIGLPIEQPITLRGTLEAELDEEPLLQKVSAQDAVAQAIERRPDLQQLKTQVEIQQIRRGVTAAQRMPSLSAFANFGYTGSVPSNRTSVLSDPDDPFTFSQTQNGFFGDAYWNPSVAVGLSLRWNIFDGFQTKNRIQQADIDIRRAELQYEQLTQSVYLEVEQALRDLDTAQESIRSQEQNIQRAELNYQFASTRLDEGVSSPLEERQASELLDQSQLNYLQAIHDLLRAQSNYEAAIGLCTETDDTLQVTQQSP